MELSPPLRFSMTRIQELCLYQGSQDEANFLNLAPRLTISSRSGSAITVLTWSINPNAAKVKVKQKCPRQILSNQLTLESFH